jgi:type II secretion system protein I
MAMTCNPNAAYRQGEQAAARQALSLLEVILALAILAAALATLGNLLGVGTRSASHARDMTVAQLLCESKMAELTAGVIPLEPVNRVPSATAPGWLYSVLVTTTEEQNLFAVRVIVEQDVEPRKRPLAFTLDRWVIDPELTLAEAVENPSADSANDGSSVPSSGVQGGDNG